MAQSRILKRALKQATRAEIQEDIDGIDAAIVELQHERELLTALLPLAKRDEIPARVVEGAVVVSRPTRKGAKQEAVLALLEDGQQWLKDQIGRALIEQGLMRDMKPDWHALTELLSRLARQDRIARPRQGVYQKLSAAKAETDAEGS